MLLLYLMHYWTVNQHLLLNTAKFHTPIINSRPERKFLYLSSIYLWLYSPCGPWPLFQFLNLYTVGMTPWMGDQPLQSHYFLWSSPPVVLTVGLSIREVWLRAIRIKLLLSAVKPSRFHCLIGNCSSYIPNGRFPLGSNGLLKWTVAS